MASVSASYEASMMLVLTPTVLHLEWPSDISTKTRTTLAVPVSGPARTRTL